MLAYGEVAYGRLRTWCGGLITIVQVVKVVGWRAPGYMLDGVRHASSLVRVDS